MTDIAALLKELFDCFPAYDDMDKTLRLRSGEWILGSFSVKIPIELLVGLHEARDRLMSLVQEKGPRVGLSTSCDCPSCDYHTKERPKWERKEREKNANRKN